MLPPRRPGPSLQSRTCFSRPAMADSVRFCSQASALRSAASAPRRKAGGPHHRPARVAVAPTAAAT
eukprot:8649976-Alexandrium_andersonii.AAC.1